VVPERRTPRPLLFVLALIATVLVLHPARASAAPSSTGKYCIVSSASGAQRESLYEIAARTLGNGNRSPEIFALNRGRLQPDGGRLTDPLVLKPGWILILPHDAKGAGVHTGSPPPVAASSSAPPSAGPSAPALPGTGSPSPMLLLGGVSAAFVLFVITVLVVSRGRRAGREAPRAAPSVPVPVKAEDDAGPPPGETLVEPVARRPEGWTSLALRPEGNSASTGPGTPATPAGSSVSAAPGGPRSPAAPGGPRSPAAPGGPGVPAGPGLPDRPGRPERLSAAEWPAVGERRPLGEPLLGDRRAGEGSPAGGRQDRSRPGPAGRDTDHDTDHDTGPGADARVGHDPSVVGVPADDRAEADRPGVSDGAGQGDGTGVAAGRKLPGDREGWPAHDDEYSDVSDLPPPGEGLDVPQSADRAERPPARSGDDAGSDLADKRSPLAANPAGGGEPPVVAGLAGPPARADASSENIDKSGQRDLSEGNAAAVACSSEDSSTLPLIDHGDAGQPSTAAPPEAPPEDPPSGGLSADVVLDGHRVAVSLVGVSGDGPGFAYGWRSAGQAPPVAALPVVVGDHDGRRLHLDLGRCPDVLTVTGALADCEKYALRLVRQLLGSGHGVAVVGDDLLGEGLPDGCRRVSTMAEVRRLTSPGVVVCGRLSGSDAAAARLSRASGGPTPMIIGEVPRSRWSVQVQPA
jgi:hypothetical protein